MIEKAESIEPVSYTINGYEYQGIATGEKGQPLIIGLHGWLDNANTFAPMIPYIEGYRLISLDMPGHGFSAHWPSVAGGGYPYHYSEIIVWLTRMFTEIINIEGLAAGQQQPILMGHSLGGTVAVMFAGLFPKKIQMCILIESLGPISSADETLPERMRKSINLQLRQSRSNLRLFPNMEAAIERRMDERNIGGPINREASQWLVQRGLAEVEGGYQWRSDKALMLPSPQYYTEQQVLATIAEITVDTLIIIGDNGLFSKHSNVETRLTAFPQKTEVRLAGRHHLHMEHPQAVADSVRAFIG
jgi:pimeloyl-ACP methyl ester carboxylesterase